MQRHFSDILKYVAVCNIIIIMKALNGFLMIQRQTILKVCNVRKLHRPRMSDDFLADSVDTTLANLYSGTTAVVVSELHDQLASLEIHAKLTRCLSAVAELFVKFIEYF